MYIRATTMSAAFVNAIGKQDPNLKNWISRHVAERAEFTKIGNVVERDTLNLSQKSHRSEHHKG